MARKCHLITRILSYRYGRVEFWENLKKLYQMCGVEEREVAFLLTDSQITNEIFLEDISNILNSGEVPGTSACCLKVPAQVASCCKAPALQYAATPAVRIN